MLVLVGLATSAPGSANASDSRSAVNLVGIEAIPGKGGNGDRGPPGTHNTLASYMESKAAFELGGDMCDLCTPAENAVLNCCSPGASWDGQCEGGMDHSWLAGYAACNGGGGTLSVSAASVIREERVARNESIQDLDPEFQRILQEKQKEHQKQKDKDRDREKRRREAHRAATKGRTGKGHAAQPGAHAERSHGAHAAKSHPVRENRNAHTHGESPKDKAKASRSRAGEGAARAGAEGAAGATAAAAAKAKAKPTGPGCAHTQENPSFDHFTLKDVDLPQCEKACLTSTCACYEYHDEDRGCQLVLKKTGISTVSKSSLAKTASKVASKRGSDTTAGPRRSSNTGHDKNRNSRNRDSTGDGSEYHAIAERLRAGKGRVAQTLRGGNRKGHSQHDMTPKHSDDQRSRAQDNNDIKTRLGSVKSRLSKWHDDFGGTPKATPQREKGSKREHNAAAEE